MAASGRRSRLGTRVSVALLSAAAFTTVIPAGSGSAGPPRAGESSGTVRTQVAAMQADVERSARLLAEGAQAWEAGSARLDRLLQEQFAADRVLEVTDADVQDAQRQLDAIANAAYRNPVPEAISAAFSLDLNHLTRSLETVHVLRRTQSTQRELLGVLSVKRASATELAARRDVVRRQAQQQQLELDRQLEALQALAAQTNSRLQAAQARLTRVQAQERARAQARREAAEAAAAAAGLQTFSFIGGGAQCSAPADGQYANGFLPPAVLCPLSTAPGHQLTGAAAAAFDRLSAARQAATGKPLCVTDSYRDFSGQVDVFARKPSLAATPGRSQHGWGLAVDLCGGAESFSTETFAWLKANAPAFGWVHPAWAEPGGGRPEPWHWEYVG